MTALAMKQKGLKPSEKIVLYWLADHHNEETGACFPRISRLAELCEMSRRSVENQLAKLEEKGLIKIKSRRREQGGKTSNSYVLNPSISDTQNLRMGYAKSAHGDTQNLRMNNLGNNNLGNELERNSFEEGFQGSFNPSKQNPKRHRKLGYDLRAISLASNAIRHVTEDVFSE